MLLWEKESKIIKVESALLNKSRFIFCECCQGMLFTRYTVMQKTKEEDIGSKVNHNLVMQQ